MALINRPFRGFSGTFARPELPLDHPEIMLQIPNSAIQEPACRLESNTIAAPLHNAVQDAPAPAHSATKHHLFTGIFHIFSKHHAHSPPKPKRRSSEEKQKPRKSCEGGRPSCEAKNMCGVVVNCGREFSEKEKATITAELERLYMEVYTKAERRKFYREAKKREEEESEQADSDSNKDPKAPDSESEEEASIKAGSCFTVDSWGSTPSECSRRWQENVEANTESYKDDRRDSGQMP